MLRSQNLIGHRTSRIDDQCSSFFIVGCWQLDPARCGGLHYAPKLLQVMNWLGAYVRNIHMVAVVPAEYKGKAQNQPLNSQEKTNG
jgi:hypothetical protein